MNEQPAPLRIGFLGSGFIAHFHLRSFEGVRNARVAGVFSPNAEHRAAFFVGHSFFNENWVVAPGSTAGRDGLGPLFNARSCSACHLRDGRSRPRDRRCRSRSG